MDHLMRRDDLFYSFGKSLPAPGTPFSQMVYPPTPDVEFASQHGAGAAAADSPLDSNAGDDRTPFAISAEVAGTATDGAANNVEVKVLGGKYSTGNGTPLAVTGGDFPTVVLDEHQYAGSTAKGNVVLFVPVQPCAAGDTGAVKCSDGAFARAVSGGRLYFAKSVPAAFPVRIWNTALAKPGFAVLIGKWATRFVAVTGGGGVTTKVNRIFIEQSVTTDVVLGGTGGGDDPHQADDTSSPFPFAATVRLVSGSWNVTVNGSSYLFPSIDAADPLADAYTITDLGNPLAVGGEGYAYLEGTRSASTDPWSVSVKFSTPGAMTPAFAAPTWQAEFDTTDGWQKKFRYLVAAVVTDGGSGYEVVQRTRSNLALVLCAVLGRPAYLPTPL